ncbi:SDR family NAD(P)-dependent oxidoreductase [Tropicibacter sp. S64]|uniref:SDR family NAD(P)-dependent oxidoreductase n=1 Tax=Tropicibacter sp. S64 TaxID=3415122 RepID=UPI003C7A9796
MERVLIIGKTGGIGSALHVALSARGVAVVGLSRSGDGLDVTDEASVAAHLGALDGVFDLVFVATGALEIGGAEPEKSLSALDARAMADQYLLNAIGPMLVLKHAVRLLPKDRQAVFAALSARVGSIGDNRLGGWYSYRAAKAGLNQLMHGAAIELARSHRQLACVCLHPGTVRTAFTEKYLGRHPSVPAEEAAERLIGVIKGLTPAQTGGFYDYAGKEIVW